MGSGSVYHKPPTLPQGTHAMDDSPIYLRQRGGCLSCEQWQLWTYGLGEFPGLPLPTVVRLSMGVYESL